MGRLGKRVAATAALAAALVGICAGCQTALAAAKLKVLYSFCSKINCTDGDQPYGGLALDASGRLLGTTGFGGKYNVATGFHPSPKGTHRWNISTLQCFSDA